MSKILLGVILSLCIIALAFIVTVLVLGSIDGLSFIDEIKSWFETTEAVEPIIEGNVEAFVNMFKII